VHGPHVSLARRPGVVHHLSISTRVIRPLNVMVTSARDRGTAPTGASTPQTGGFERLRLSALDRNFDHVSMRPQAAAW
jgi:hypothetical protein